MKLTRIKSLLLAAEEVKARNGRTRGRSKAIVPVKTIKS